MARFVPWILAVSACLCVVPSVQAYIDKAPTLMALIREARTITLVEVERFDRDGAVAMLKKVRDLKGESKADPVRHVLRSEQQGIDRALLEWAEAGSRCVVFMNGNNVVVCLGESWYQATSAGDNWWRLDRMRPELPLAYFGTTTRLAEAIPVIAAGKNAVITILPHGANNEGASFDVALNRASLPGLVKVQRISANLRMPAETMELGSNDAYFRGAGRVERADLAVLQKQLHAADATARAEAAADVGWLGTDALSAAEDLAALLSDKLPMVRLAAAAALCRVNAKDPRPLKVLSDGLASEHVSSRRHAARATGLAGSAAAPLAKKLAELLKDSDETVRRLSLQSLATLGPVAADSVDTVTSLLDEPGSAVEAADALGRMGPAAQSALKRLTKMLSADSAAHRWAAVRAMAQIGGPGAEPAVRFMIRELPTAQHVESYNMLIYLSLLGPVAKDAIPAVRQARVMNSALRDTTVWAIDPGTELPNLGGAGNQYWIQYILESYIHEFGDRFRPVATTLARDIMSGNARNVPAWGYKLLARCPQESLKVFVPALADERLVMRERATVALGFMGRAASSAKPQITQALKGSQDEREQLLLRWCLREID
jgi:hypothetical protein